MRWETKLIAGVVIGTTLFTAGVGYLCEQFYAVGCEETALVMQKEYKYSIYTGCMIKGPDGYYPLRQHYYYKGRG